MTAVAAVVVRLLCVDRDSVEGQVVVVIVVVVKVVGGYLVVVVVFVGLYLVCVPVEVETEVEVEIEVEEVLVPVVGRYVVVTVRAVVGKTVEVTFLPVPPAVAKAAEVRRPLMIVASFIVILVVAVKTACA